MARLGRKIARWLVVGALLGGGIGGYLWMKRGIEPTAKGAPFYVRYNEPTTLPKVLYQIKEKGVVREPLAYRAYAFLKKTPQQIRAGTYQLRAGMTADELFRELRKPISQMVRIPETNWAQRTANHLERKYNVFKAEEYMALVRNPSAFKGVVGFPLPEKSLEGYLYPDTYDLPPLLGARGVIERQLKAFERKVWEPLKHPKDLHRILTVASMVELEAGRDDERAAIAGVIENRLDRNMRLQIDATILYGIQKWKRLTYADYRNLDTPYNTYTNDGLPPGPICSPTYKSIVAAMNPDQEGGHLFYVAIPNERSAFAPTYGEHLRNIKRRRQAMKALEESKQ